MRFFQFTAAFMLSLGLALPLTAQQEVPTELPEIKAEDVTVGQVVSFVNAMIAAERVRQEYLVKIDAAESEEEIQDLVAEADQKGMAEVDRVRGITPAEYMAIAIAARDSEELSARIEQRLALMKQSQGVTIKEAPAERPDDAIMIE